jgi:hypothetical protein
MLFFYRKCPKCKWLCFIQWNGKSLADQILGSVVLEGVPNYPDYEKRKQAGYDYVTIHEHHISRFSPAKKPLELGPPEPGIYDLNQAPFGAKKATCLDCFRAWISTNRRLKRAQTTTGIIFFLFFVDLPGFPCSFKLIVVVQQVVYGASSQ